MVNEYRKGRIKNSSGNYLHYVLQGEPEGHAVAIIAHGFPGDIRELGKFNELARKLAYEEPELPALRFYFSGHRKGDDTPITVTQLVDDLESVIHFARKQYDGIGVLGYSMGGLVALESYGPGKIDSMVLWNPLTAPRKNYREDQLKRDDRRWEQINGLWKLTPLWRRPQGAKENYFVSDIFFEEIASVNQQELLSRVKCPVLIIEGENDQLLEDSRKGKEILRSSGNTQSRLKVVENTDHYFGDFKSASVRDEVLGLTRNWFLGV